MFVSPLFPFDCLLICQDHEADLTNVPTVEQIHAFLAKIFTRSDLSAEVRLFHPSSLPHWLVPHSSSQCGVMAMCYIDRLVTLSGMFLLPSNYRRIILSAIILAAKSASPPL